MRERYAIEVCFYTAGSLEGFEVKAVLDYVLDLIFYCLSALSAAVYRFVVLSIP